MTEKDVRGASAEEGGLCQRPAPQAAASVSISASVMSRREIMLEAGS
ncbi:hypothetical protein MPC4_30166 [Methylocella tundrae]|uniref:Uncharacterized protein n=1 Tax=Methylocella tundrae TaxID=227605 RepID=A0A8B6MA29_METTU|nr:hypothetical protein MPC1_2930002 [Methylocella tundrae]VTZ50982.1 hypothetical protein MPC4_30166 [Methylocella tundrae]